MPRKPYSFTVIIDTQEATEQHRGYFLGDDKPSTTEAVVMHLKTGDYSVMECPQAVVERKGLVDYWGCLVSGRERFERELERLTAFSYPLVVIEATWADLCEPWTYSKVSPLTAQNSLLSWQQRFRIPFLLAGTRVQAKRIVLQHFEMAIVNHKRALLKEDGV